MTNRLPRFESVIEHHHDEIFGYLWRLLDGGGRADETLDLTQDVFMRTFRAYPRLRPGSNIRAWLYRIATNCAYNAFKRRPVTSLPDDILDPAPQPAQQVWQAETLDAVQRAVEALPTKQRAVLILRYLHEFSYAEIATALQCSESSARANVYQALRHLRRELPQDSNGFDEEER